MIRIEVNVVSHKKTADTIGGFVFNFHSLAHATGYKILPRQLIQWTRRAVVRVAEFF